MQEVVVSEFDVDFVAAREDFRAEVGEDEAVGAEPVSVAGDLRVVQVRRDAGFEKGAFADEQVCPVRVLDSRSSVQPVSPEYRILLPSTVTSRASEMSVVWCGTRKGIERGRPRSAAPHPAISSTNRAGTGAVRRPRRGTWRWNSAATLSSMPGGPAMVRGRVRGSTIDVFEQQKRHAGEVVAVHVADQNGVYGTGAGRPRV